MSKHLAFILLWIALEGCGSTGNGSRGEDGAVDRESGQDSLPTTDAPESTAGSEVERDGHASVTAVAVTGEPGAYTFSVTVHSADIDCSQYADWWEVVSESGELLYRRILVHSHTEANGSGNPFTRSGGPVPVAADQRVIVRAHLNTSGYAGSAMAGSVSSGFEEDRDLADGFAAGLAAVAPLPDGCAF